MIPHRLTAYRTSLIISICTAALLAVFLMMTAFRPEVSAADEPVPRETPSTPTFEPATPYVCAIPDDGAFLPCHANLLADALPIERSPVAQVSNFPCNNGMAGQYPCHNVDLLTWLPLSNFGGTQASDLWGWTDPETGQEIVILTLMDRTAFVDTSDPFAPVVLGTLAKTAGANNSPWRDVKTYSNTAYIVGDIAGDFGMQIFDLTRLRGVTETMTFTADSLYTGISSTHNIVINEQTGLAALVGTSLGEERCDGGMHLLDLTADRLNPTFAGCVDEDGYVHDAQCVIYHGADAAYVGQEICFNFNEDAITIVDVTDRSNPIQLSRSTYTQSAYTHQGWISADHGVMLVDDEQDEQILEVNTTTHIWDISSLTAPEQIGTYTATTAAIDHNQYVHFGYSFQANYRAGLRILDTADVGDAVLNEVAFFDVFPDDDEAQFNGAWSAYPYFKSGVVAISGAEQGLFLVRPTALERYRARLKAPASMKITEGETAVVEMTLETLGLPDRYLVRQLSAAWPTALDGPATFDADATSLLTLPISVTAPMTVSGQAELFLLLESENRPGHFITATTQLEVVPRLPFDVLIDTASLSVTSSTDLEIPVVIVNRAGLTESYTLEAAGDQWSTRLSVTQTAVISDGEQADLALLMTVVDGVQNSVTLTVTPASNSAEVQVLTRTIMITASGQATVEADFAPRKITYTVRLTNTGDFPDRFRIDLDNAGSFLSVFSSTILSANESIEAEFTVAIGSGLTAPEEVRLVSVRSGQAVATAKLPQRVVLTYLPLILLDQ